MSKSKQLSHFCNTVSTTNRIYIDELMFGAMVNGWCKFYVSVRGKDHSCCKRNSLLSVRAAFNRHLKSPPYNKKIPSARYFYNHLSNYTKTIIRLRLGNIGEYFPRLRLGEYSPIFTLPSMVIVKYCKFPKEKLLGCSIGESFFKDGLVHLWRVHQN